MITLREAKWRLVAKRFLKKPYFTRCDTSGRLVAVWLLEKLHPPALAPGLFPRALPLLVERPLRLCLNPTSAKLLTTPPLGCQKVAKFEGSPPLARYCVPLFISAYCYFGISLHLLKKSSRVNGRAHHFRPYFEGFPPLPYKWVVLCLITSIFVMVSGSVGYLWGSVSSLCLNL